MNEDIKKDRPEPCIQNENCAAYFHTARNQKQEKNKSTQLLLLTTSNMITRSSFGIKMNQSSLRNLSCWSSCRQSASSVFFNVSVQWHFLNDSIITLAMFLKSDKTCEQGKLQPNRHVGHWIGNTLQKQTAAMLIFSVSYWWLLTCPVMYKQLLYVHSL